MLKKIFYHIFCIIFYIIFFNCYPSDPAPIFREYDPKKAGAEILESYDLSDIYVTNTNDFYIHFSEFGGKYYFVHNYKIYIFDKNSMIKEREINLDIRNFYPEFSSLNKDYYYNTDIAVNKDKILFSYNLFIKNLNFINKISIFDMDLSGDNFRELDASSDLGLYIGPLQIGYNSGREHIWILDNKYDIYYYKYDKTSDNYIKSYLIYAKFLAHGQLSFYNDTVWYSYEPRALTGEVYIEERNLNESNIILKKIDVNYLGTLSSPEDVHFDGEYLWIIIEKDGKMQLLKLGTDLVK